MTENDADDGSYVFELGKYTYQVCFCVICVHVPVYYIYMFGHMVDICSNFDHTRDIIEFVLVQVKQDVEGKPRALKPPIQLDPTHFRHQMDTATTLKLITLTPLFTCLNDAAKK